jgi:hypothetical protein
MNEGNMRSVINVALFDVFSTEFTSWPEDLAKARRKDIRQKAKEMLENETFLDAISRSTNSTRNVRTRFEFVSSHIRPLLS